MYKILPESENAIIGIEVSQKIDITQEREMISILDKLVAEHGRINLLVVVGEHMSATPHAILTDMKWITTHAMSLAKLAVVTDSKVLAWLTDQDAKIAKHMDIAEKHFDKKDMETAWIWIKSK